jgi:hypothetical protein
MTIAFDPIIREIEIASTATTKVSRDSDSSGCEEHTNLINLDPASRHYPLPEPPATYLYIGTLPVPEIISYTPTKGTAGTKIYLYFTSLYELMTTNTLSFFLIFVNQKVQESLQKLSQQGGISSYTVTTEVPEFALTGWTFMEMRFSMFIESGDGHMVAEVDVRTFSYLNSSVQRGNFAIARGGSIEIPPPTIRGNLK